MYVTGKWTVLNMRLNPFKAGDKVYCPMLSEKILKVVQYDSKLFWVDEYGQSVRFNNLGVVVNSAHASPVIFYSTQENYLLLSKLYPNTWFEEPK